MRDRMHHVDLLFVTYCCNVSLSFPAMQVLGETLNGHELSMDLHVPEAQTTGGVRYPLLHMPDCDSHLS
mgnify:CR=1 FL=1